MILSLLIACPVCWGGADTLAEAAKAGVLFLLAVVVCVLVAIALIARSWARRAAELDAQDRLA